MDREAYNQISFIAVLFSKCRYTAHHVFIDLIGSDEPHPGASIRFQDWGGSGQKQLEFP